MWISARNYSYHEENNLYFNEKITTSYRGWAVLFENLNGVGES